jgi:UDP-2-acetamido-3-amino-2,3-dideoxy-glucuronate N-acetyltransferase
MSEFGARLNFNKEGFAFCEESNEKYQLLNNQVVKL